MFKFFEMCYVDFFGGRGDDGECVSVVQVGWCGCFLCLMSCGGSAPGFGGLGSLGSSFGI